MEGVKFVGITPQEKLVEVIRKYYHDKQAPIRKATVWLTQPWEKSHIRGEYAEGYEAEGGVKMLSFEEVCNLYDDLKKLGVADIKQTKDVFITVEVGHVVEVQQTYYII